MAKISIIICGRNDDWSGDFTERMFRAISFNTLFLQQAKIEFDYIFVEWRPIKNKPFLAEEIIKRVPQCSKCYVCGEEFHAHMADNPNLLFLEFVAKNVALKRLEADFGITTNCDVIFGKNLVANLHNLDSNVLYRSLKRLDIQNIKYNKPEDLDNPKYLVKTFIARPPRYSEGAGEFTLASKTLWHKLQGYDENIRFAKIHLDGRACAQAVAMGVKIVPIGDVKHLWHSSTYWYRRNKEGKLHNSNYGPEWRPLRHLPYKNTPEWGLDYCDLEEIAPKIFKLKSRIPLRQTIPTNWEVPKEYRK